MAKPLTGCGWRGHLFYFQEIVMATNKDDNSRDGKQSMTQSQQRSRSGTGLPPDQHQEASQQGNMGGSQGSDLQNSQSARERDSDALGRDLAEARAGAKAGGIKAKPLAGPARELEDEDERE
jgi:hypothetical protein